MKGYDLDLIEKVRERTNLPITVMGGAVSLQNIENLINKHGIIGVAAGSLFVFRGPYKAVLINYQTKVKKK
jgi:cyclase